MAKYVVLTDCYFDGLFFEKGQEVELPKDVKVPKHLKKVEEPKTRKSTSENVEK